MNTTTDRDVREYVEATLTYYAAEFDIDAIVDDLRATDWWPVPFRGVATLDDMPEYWAIVARHEVS